MCVFVGGLCVCVCRWSVCVCVFVGGLLDVWLMLESLNVDVKDAVRCSSLVDVLIDEDDVLVECLLRLSSIHSACRSVLLSSFYSESGDHVIKILICDWSEINVVVVFVCCSCKFCLYFRLLKFFNLFN